MRLKEMVVKQIKPELVKKYSANPMALPEIQKVTINVGLGKFKESKEILALVKKEMTQIFGQAPKWTAAKKSVSGFKIREGQMIGYCLTLRNGRMWDFLERFINVALPRIRDFEGISSQKFDRQGNFTIGLQDQTIFPEVKPDEIKENWGMSITINGKNFDNAEMTREYLKAIGFIFK